MRVLMVTAELWPLAKVGGLADMVGSLAGALGRIGHDVRSAIPRYRDLVERVPPGLRETGTREVSFVVRHGRVSARVVRVEGEDLPSPVDLVAHDTFDRPGIYLDPATRRPYEDNGLRWAIFCRAVHAAVGSDGWVPDVVHAHDHQTALVPALLRWAKLPGRLARRPATVFTIHNLGYQGIEPPSWAELSGLPRGLEYAAGPIEFHGQVNLMKMGIVASDRLTTVSPRYAEEIRASGEFGAGLEGVLAGRADRLSGILNGIDGSVWDPGSDPHLPFRYGPESLAGKGKVAAALRRELGLDDSRPRAPLVGMVTRLASQKGIDILLPVLDRILDDGVQMVILGSGDERYESALREAARRRPGRMAFRTGHEEELAHRIEGGADMFLMPSRYEPCGLNQMYSLRYGAVPLVRAVGGLADTVVDLDEDPERANGFVFRAYEPAELLKTVRRAVRIWRDRGLWRALVLRGMAADFSWERSAGRYEEVYREALADRDAEAVAAPRAS